MNKQDAGSSILYLSTIVQLQDPASYVMNGIIYEKPNSQRFHF